MQNKPMILWDYLLPAIFYPQSKQDSCASAPFSILKRDKPFIRLIVGAKKSPDSPGGGLGKSDRYMQCSDDDSSEDSQESSKFDG
jgi:hypothetical protein